MKIWKKNVLSAFYPVCGRLNGQTRILYTFSMCPSFSANDRNVIKHHKSKTHSRLVRWNFDEKKERNIKKKTKLRIIQLKQHLENQNQIH